MNFEELTAITIVKGISIGCTLLASGLLAWRVRDILSALSLMTKTHEFHFEQLANDGHITYNVTGGGKHLEKANKFGTKLLVLGFLLYGFAAIANGVGLWMEHDQKVISNTKAEQDVHGNTH